MTLDDCSPLQWRDALTLLCGDLIGSGISRQTYECRTNADYVVKVQTDTERFQNQMEWLVWEAARWQPKLRRWFAPCASISDCGLWLLQARTEPVSLKELKRRVPRVPKCFTDLKADNWGRLGSRLVCHDYGTIMVAQYGLTASMKRAEWW